MQSNAGISLWKITHRYTADYTGELTALPDSASKVAAPAPGPRTRNFGENKR